MSHFQKMSVVMALVLLYLSGVFASVLRAQDDPAPALSEVDAQAAALQQRELIKKQEAFFRAAQSLEEAEKSEQSKNWNTAKQLYLSAITALTPPAPATEKLYARAVAGLVRSNNALFQEAKAKGNFDEAERILRNTLTYDPTNKEAQTALDKLQAVRKNPNDTSLYKNPALNPTFTRQVDTVQSLFIEAEQFRRTGQYDEAESRLRKILAIDPYNETAIRQLDKVRKEKNSYAKVAEEQTRQQRIREVEQKWSQPEKRESLETIAAAVATPITRSNSFQINQKLRSIVLPSLDFNDASLQAAVDYLNAKTRELDPGKEGINFIPRPEALAVAKNFNLNLRNVPLGEALRYIAQLANVKFKVDQNAIFFVPLQESTEVLVRRQFNVSPSFFPVTQGVSADSSNAITFRRTVAAGANSGDNGAATVPVTDALKERGVVFSVPGSNAIYLAGQGVLQVTNTQDQIDLLEELVNADAGQTLMVDIEARLVEINQTDLNELTSNTSFNILNDLGVGSTQLLNTPEFVSGLRGSKGLSTTSLDALLGGTAAPTPSRFELTGPLDSRVYSLVLAALNQKNSTDLLSSPSIRVRSGEKGTVNITRTFFYPQNYKPPQIVQITNTNNNNTNNNNNNNTNLGTNPAAAIPAFPDTFAKEELGVTLNIQPTIGGDNRTIDLSLLPEVVDFEGFINYGDPITIPDSQGNLFTLVSNQINQPVFNVRSINTKVLLRDGYTVVLGGIIREDIEKINDKVPILGDIPLLGRIFQSKVSRNIKKNLLIFVTGRILRPDGELYNSRPPDTTVTTSR